MPPLLTLSMLHRTKATAIIKTTRHLCGNFSGGWSGCVSACVASGAASAAACAPSLPLLISGTASAAPAGSSSGRAVVVVTLLSLGPVDGGAAASRGARLGRADAGGAGHVLEVQRWAVTPLGEGRRSGDLSSGNETDAQAVGPRERTAGALPLWHARCINLQVC